ncbi:hypothetical protein CPY51_08935 [Rhizobium tubonense]|uniref:Uncharacterized protein n=2 Tax=Rhizobium tubonense TaxID=484088 RepID=A0A2W4EM78_9HYPH|nr:hypothetical protein CPY51_08935 [Rhizobium tubonense]
MSDADALSPLFDLRKLLSERKINMPNVAAVDANQTIATAGVLGDACEMGRRIRSMDWTHSSLGHLDDWEKSFRATVGHVLSSKLSMFIAWGDQGIPHDSFIPILAARHRLHKWLKSAD